MATGRLIYDGDNRYTEKEARVHKLTDEVEEKIDAIPGVVDDVTSESTTDALSAHMGKVLQDQIDNLSGLNKFLSTWDCTTGLPITNPVVDPYVYTTGDYYIVAEVAAQGGTNIRPHGDRYRIGIPSTAVETDIVNVNDWYIYDGSQWVLQINTVHEISIDEGLSPTSRNPVENRAVYNALTTKQNSILDLNTIREGAAAGATAVQPGDNIDTLTNNMHYQTLGDVTTLINDAVIGGLTPDINTKTFYLSDTSDLVTGKAIYDWKQAGKNAIIVLDGKTYFRDHITNLYPNRWICYEPVETEIATVAGISGNVSYLAYPSLTFTVANDAVTSITAGTLYGYQFLQPGIDYTTPYTPEYDGSPATKKYVDDSIEETKTSGSTAPSNPEPGTIWYNTTNNNTYIYNGTDWEEVISNLKMFYLADANDTTTAQAIIDFYEEDGWQSSARNTPFINYNHRVYILTEYEHRNGTDARAVFRTIPEQRVNDEFQLDCGRIFIRCEGTTVVQISITTEHLGQFFDSDTDATKQYVDTAIAHASSSGSTAPANPEPGNTWYDTTNNILKVWDGTKWVSIQELLVSGTNIKTINGQSILGSGDLSTGEIVFVTAQEYAALPATKETDGKVYFIYE